MYEVDIDGVKKKVNQDMHVSLLLAMESVSLPISVGCTVGVCEVCKVRVIDGMDNIEIINDNIFDLSADEILPCCVVINGDIKIENI
jgi:ferredoxin